MSEWVPYLTTEELKVLFGYKSTRCVTQALHIGSLPLPFYYIRRRIVVDKEVARLFFAKARKQGKTKLGNLRF